MCPVSEKVGCFRAVAAVCTPLQTLTPKLVYLKKIIMYHHLLFCHCLLFCSQMSQELGITEKSPDFMNPYRTERDDVSIMHEGWANAAFFPPLATVPHTDLCFAPLLLEQCPQETCCRSRLKKYLCLSLIRFRFFTQPKLSRRSWGRRRRGGERRRRGKKSEKALASPAPALNYSAAPQRKQRQKRRASVNKVHETCRLWRRWGNERCRPP